MIPVEEAFRQILSRVPPVSVERLSLEQANGRILQESVPAERDAPPFDRVMMDGYAIQYHHPLTERFTISGIALAGHLPPVLGGPGECIEVTTGCPLPSGCDTVIPVEDCIIDGNGMRLEDDASPRKNQYIHMRGSDGPAGRIVLEPGTRIGPPELAILATEGVRQVKVARIPRIRLLTTGDEIVIDDDQPGQEQIRGSHYEALRGLFHAYPGTVISRSHAGDDAADLLLKLRESLQGTDILLVTGGVSRGRKDMVPDLLKKLGVAEVFHRVAQRPGKPLWFGQMGNKLVLGLPGNPISSLICARRYVFPLMEKWMGNEPRDALRISVAGRIEPLAGLTRFLPVKFDETGLSAQPFTTSGSLHDLVGTDGFIEVPADDIPEATFKYFPWNSR